LCGACPNSEFFDDDDEGRQRSGNKFLLRRLTITEAASIVFRSFIQDGTVAICSSYVLPTEKWWKPMRNRSDRSLAQRVHLQEFIQERHTMEIIVSNNTKQLLIVMLNSGATLYLPPGATSAPVDDMETNGNAKVTKLVQSGAINVRAQ
jgi:hypothetical protein